MDFQRIRWGNGVLGDVKSQDELFIQMKCLREMNNFMELNAFTILLKKLKIHRKLSCNRIKWRIKRGVYHESI